MNYKKTLAVTLLVATTQAQLHWERNWVPSLTQQEYTQKIDKFAIAGNLLSNYVAHAFDGYELKTFSTIGSLVDCTKCLTETKVVQKAA